MNVSMISLLFHTGTSSVNVIFFVCTIFVYMFLIFVSISSLGFSIKFSIAPRMRNSLVSFFSLNSNALLRAVTSSMSVTFLVGFLIAGGVRRGTSIFNGSTCFSCMTFCSSSSSSSSVFMRRRIAAMRTKRAGMRKSNVCRRRR